MHHGYEPSRITDLGQRSRRAVDALNGIHSTDPAAAEAMAAVAGLKSVIADRLIPATTTIGTMNPLGGGAVSGTLIDEWFDTKFPSNPYHGFTDEELFDELATRSFGDLPLDERNEPDMDDPFWIDFEVLAQEISRRAAHDDDFAGRLVHDATRVVLTPLLVEFAPFEPSLVAEILVSVMHEDTASPLVFNEYTALGAETLLTFLIDHPDIALEMLADPVHANGDDVALLEHLLVWPFLDQEMVAEFLQTTMGAPFVAPDEPGLLDAAGEVLQDLVALTGSDAAPKGFRPETSAALARVIVLYLPLFATSLENDDTSVNLKDFDLIDTGIALGDYGDVVDLLGAVMRDPDALDVILSGIVVLTVLGDEWGGPLPIGSDEVADYAQLLANAAANEQIEDDLIAARERGDANAIIDFVDSAIRLLVGATGKSPPPGIDLSVTVAKRFVDWMITADDVGLDDVERVAYLLVTLTVGAAFLRTRNDSEDDDETAERAGRAEDAVRDIDQMIADGRSVDDVQGRIEDLQDDLERLGDVGSTRDDVWEDARVRPSGWDLDDVDTEE